MPALTSRRPSPLTIHPTRPEPVESAPRIATDIDAVWQLTERLAMLGGNPAAALELVARTAGELTRAEAAAVLLHPANELVLASRWGAIGVPLGSKSPDVRRGLDAAWSARTSMAIRSGTHDIGCLWVGRHAGAFDLDEQRVLRTLAAVTSLALPALLPARSAALRTPAPPTPPTVHARTSTAVDSERLLPEALRLAVFPPALRELVRALDGAHVAAIAAAVQADSVLATLVVRAANGAAAGRARPTRSIQEAVVFLGLHRVRALALAQFTKTLLADRTALDALLWEQAIGTALRTREMLVAIATFDADVGLLAGLLHPIGAVALATAHRDRYERVLLASVREDRPLPDVERAEFGVASAVLTQQLLHAWHLAPLLRGTPHDTTESLQRTLEWATAVTLAENPAWRGFVASAARAPVRWVDARIEASVRALGLDAALLADVLARGDAAVAETRRLFDTPSGAVLNS